MRQHNRCETYKASFVRFIEQLDWDWFITLGIGHCPDDGEVIRRLRLIEARLCKRYLRNRYHKLPHCDRFTMAVAFEGERSLGNRHAHILVHIPTPLKHCASRPMLVSHFPSQFQFLWHVMRPTHDRFPPPWQPRGIDKPMVFGRVNTARKIYTVKRVQEIELPWSRFEFVTPPKVRKFENENLSVIRNRDQQKRIAIKRYEANRLNAIT